MRCHEVWPLVDAYVDGVLEEVQAAELERHAPGCARCTSAVARARGLKRALEAPAPVRAPAGFAGRVMDAVYREALRGAPGEAAAEPSAPPRTGVPARVYRRLGYSCVVTAAVLAVTLAVPRLAYTGLVDQAGVQAGGASIVQNVMAGAAESVRGALGETGGGATR
jgi:anti-sigma factor RsiW